MAGRCSFYCNEAEDTMSNTAHEIKIEVKGQKREAQDESREKEDPVTETSLCLLKLVDPAMPQPAYFPLFSSLPALRLSFALKLIFLLPQHDISCGVHRFLL